ncbi:peptide-methionine (S)-S-oxide reductase MsrA [Paenibacillus borealis]|uniref:Peptide methionine sulfoxide reductase MsrA n=1 Tax=Paenibacillus borealis TaxID=160799 RepID=A0A089L504_PAEBO|nr:peptide-methionine (S)-S-oxide reductase MsrA [Paenibacillus borealis]AIQ56546.1 methionine sulfoxide reductase [Paenibacillus borealis]
MNTTNKQQLATFAGGCFWCMVKPFDELPGIVSVVSGYTGGHTEKPTYEDLETDTTGHREAVQITFEPERFPYERLLDIYWQLIDPTDSGGQFMDRGRAYEAAIFVHSEEQREQAERSKEALKASKRFKAPIVTEILPATTFYPAEAEHQHYYRTHPLDYKLYQKGSGRDDFTELHWNGRDDKKQLLNRLTELQYEVTQKKAMEPPYQNEYWNHFEEGIYADIISGDPLFSSQDKFDSGTGWPGFTRPLEEGLVRREADYSGGEVRTVLRSRLSGAYLGHLFYDGPEPAKLHYRVNSAALRFIPKTELTDNGLGRYLELFERESRV